MRIFVLGDVHADTLYTRQAIKAAAEFECDWIVQVGDFGFWPKAKGGPEFLSGIRKELKATGIPLVFVRGNHEDHDELDRLDACHGPDSLLTPEGFVVIREPKKGAIYSAPRSGNWEWDGVRFGCVGGAYSIDRQWRVKYVSWYPQEMPTFADVDKLQPCDVLFTHDSPVPLIHDYKPGGETSQEVIRAALRKARPSLHMHGHWHVRETYEFERTTCVALDANIGPLPYACAVIDTTTGMWYNYNQALYDQKGTAWRAS